MTKPPNSPLEEFASFEPQSGPIALLGIHVLNGANYFSGGPVIRFTIDLGPFDEVFTDALDGFTDRLLGLMPTLFAHHCSPGVPGGFVQRLREGTLLGHVMEHVAIELQSLAGMRVGFGKTRMTRQQGVYNVVFRFADELGGIYAGKWALHLINNLLTGKDLSVPPVIDHLVMIREMQLPGFSTQAIMDEAAARRIKTIRLDRYNLVQLGSGCHRKLIRATITSFSSLIAVEACDHKHLVMQFLEEGGVPVPKSRLVESADQAVAFREEVAGPVVLKPLAGYHGNGISLGLAEPEAIVRAYDRAVAYDPLVLAQEMVEGRLFRFLVIGHQVAAVAELFPPEITGNGQLTALELMEDLNRHPLREKGDKGVLSVIEPDDETWDLLAFNGLKSDSIVPAGMTVRIRNSGNIRLGGHAANATHQAHLWNQTLAVRISHLIGLDVAGVDMICPDISQPLPENGGKVIAVCAAPDFRMHLKPLSGDPIQVEKAFVDWLFPPGKPASVPLVSITGSHGKARLAEILRKYLQPRYQCIGMVRESGLLAGNHCIRQGEALTSKNTELVLKDPTIDFVIVETPVETILEHGIGYAFADVGIVLNLDPGLEKYYGYDHIRDLEDVAYAKSVVAEEVYEQGFSILNADYGLILDMLPRIVSQPLLFSLDYSNREARNHARKGGRLVISDGQKIVFMHGSQNQDLMLLSEMPAWSGSAGKWEQEVLLAGCATLWALGADLPQIRTFFSTLSLEQTQ